MLRTVAASLCLFTAAALSADDHSIVPGRAPQSLPLPGSAPLSPIPETRSGFGVGPAAAPHTYSAGPSTIAPQMPQGTYSSPPVGGQPVPFGAAGPYAHPGLDISYQAGSLHAPATTEAFYGIGNGGLGYSAMGFGPMWGGPMWGGPMWGGPTWGGPFVGAQAGGLYPRFPYYSYRRPWYFPGPAGMNVDILW